MTLSTPLASLTPLPSPANRQEKESCDHFLALLGEFYEDLPELPAICATFVPAETIPQPQRGLLVHFRDMTSTLTQHHGEPVA